MNHTIRFVALPFALWLTLMPDGGVAQNPQRQAFYQGTPANPKIQAMVDSVSAERIRLSFEKLAGYHTRHANSDTVSATNGIGAARRWIKSQFEQASAAGGGALQPEFFSFNANICGFSGRHANVTATLPGTMPAARERTFLVSGHLDSRTIDVCDANSFAPGVNDDGSGTAASIELARVMSRQQFDATLIFMTVTGEEQGLFGSRAYATQARGKNARIDGMLNNDIIGNIIDCSGKVDSTSVRLFSIGPSTSSSRQLARYLMLKGEQYVPTMKIKLIPAQDRPMRGGDHIPFNENGYAAVRFTETAECTDRQHNALDLLKDVSPGYAAQVTRISLAGLASLAWAPATPAAPLVVRDAGNGAEVFLSWTRSNLEPDFAGYRVAWRHPDSLFYQKIISVGNVTEFTFSGLTQNQAVYVSYSALDAEGNESIFSPEVLAIPQVVPAAPQELASTSTPADIRLSWKPNLELDLAGYIITRIGPDANVQNFTVDAAATSFRDNTAQPHTLYRYTLKARDLQGNESVPAAPVRGQLATHDRNIFILDATKDGSDRPLQPTDEQVDRFYERLLQNFQLAGQWDVADSAQQQLAISDADVAIYSTVIVHSEVTPPANAVVRDTLALKKYLQNGGRLLMVGWGLLGNVSGKPELIKTFQAGDFVYDYMKIASGRTGAGTDRDFKGADAVAANYPSVTIDPAKVPLFGGNLLAMDVFQPLADGAQTEVLYTYRSSSQPPSTFHGQPVALRHLSNGLRLIVLDFPLFFIPEAEAMQVIRQALLDLGETPTAVQEPSRETAPKKFDLSQNYPNPLGGSALPPETSIQYQLPRTSQVKLVIYNLMGQRVAALVEKQQPAGSYSIPWDGKDESGKNVAGGIYLYRLETKDFVKVRKLVLLR